jgi:hypothetical protein
MEFPHTAVAFGRTEFLMNQLGTITVELHIPAALVAMDIIEKVLRANGFIPEHAEQLRWRLDTDTPGGYVLSYVCEVRPVLLGFRALASDVLKEGAPPDA